MIEDRLMPISEVATTLHVSSRSIHKWLSAGRFPKPLRLGRVLRWRVSDVRRFMDCDCNMATYDGEMDAAGARR